MFLFNKHAFHIMVEVRAVQMKTLLVFPPFWVQSLVWILHLNPRPPFCVLFSWLLFIFLLPGLIAWVDAFFFFFLCSYWRCIVHGGKWPTRLWMQPSFYIFLCMNVHLWCLCNTLCVMWPSFQNGICSDLWLTIFSMQRWQRCLKLKLQLAFPSHMQTEEEYRYAFT